MSAGQCPGARAGDGGHHADAESRSKDFPYQVSICGPGARKARRTGGRSQDNVQCRGDREFRFRGAGRGAAPADRRRGGRISLRPASACGSPRRAR